MANKFPPKGAVERLRAQYPAGCRVELVAMNDPYSALRPGDKGTIDFFDDTGTAFVKWDSGSELGIVYGVDQFRVVEKEVRFNTGAEFWRDAVTRLGADGAAKSCAEHFGATLTQELSREEHTFCRELFAAAYATSADVADSAKIVYPYSFAKAQERSEASIYHMSRRKNEQCAKAIDAEISNSYFKTNHYNLDLAALKVLYDFGFERVSAVLAHNFREHDYDGRYSAANKEWARAIDVPEQAFKHTYLNAHPILIEDFTNYARKFYEQVGAAAHALPGAAEHGTVIADYEVVRSIAFDDERGFAIGQHPAAACPFVCWQFTSENGVRDFYWGTYCDTEKEASDNFCARVMTHMYGEAVQEISQAAVSAPTPPPSVLGKIREARVAPESPSSPAPYRNREEPEL